MRKPRGLTVQHWPNSWRERLPTFASWLNNSEPFHRLDSSSRPKASTWELAQASALARLLTEELVDRARERCDFLRQRLVLRRELGVRLQELVELVGLRLDGVLGLRVADIDSVGEDLV